MPEVARTKEKGGVIGRLRHRVSVQQKAQVADGIGGFTESWTALSGMPVFALIEPRKASQVWFGQKQEHRVTHFVMIRYRAGITQEMRVSFGSRIFQIHGFTNFEERGQWLALHCEEGMPS